MDTPSSSTSECARPGDFLPLPPCLLYNPRNFSDRTLPTSDGRKRHELVTADEPSPGRRPSGRGSRVPRKQDEASITVRSRSGDHARALGRRGRHHARQVHERQRAGVEVAHLCTEYLTTVFV